MPRRGSSRSTEGHRMKSFLLLTLILMAVLAYAYTGILDHL